MLDKLLWNYNEKVMYVMHFDVLVQDCSNSIANALELLQSCTKPSMYPMTSLLYIWVNAQKQTNRSNIKCRNNLSCVDQYKAPNSKYTGDKYDIWCEASMVRSSG